MNRAVFWIAGVAAAWAAPRLAFATEAEGPVAPCDAERPLVARYVGQGHATGALFTIGVGMVTPVPHVSTTGPGQTCSTTADTSRDACSATGATTSCSAVRPGSQNSNCSSQPGAGGSGDECSAYGTGQTCSADSSKSNSNNASCSAYSSPGQQSTFTICSASDDNAGTSCSSLGGGATNSAVSCSSYDNTSSSDGTFGAFCSVRGADANYTPPHEVECTNVTPGSTGCSSHGSNSQNHCSTLHFGVTGGDHGNLQVTVTPMGPAGTCSSNSP